ncbi:hypothetical protein IWQ56_002530, partial [Coemansia nantahalensis]
MEQRAVESEEQPPAAAGYDGQAAPAHLSLLNAPNRYAVDIQGALVAVPRPAASFGPSAPALHGYPVLNAEFEELLAQYEGAAHEPQDPVYGGFGQNALPAPPAFFAGVDASAGHHHWAAAHSFSGQGPGHSTPYMLDMPVPYAETPGATPGVTPSAHLLGYPAAPPVAHLPPFPYPPTHAVAHVRQVSDGEIVLSDGELPPQDAGDDLSDGEIVEVGAWPHARPADPRGPAYPASDGSDVIGIVKGRVGDILGLKDPKLLQSARLRALMLLLKCIKLDDPDAIYAHIKDTQLAVASELNVLAHEFRLDMIADACMNAVLTTRTVTAGPAVSAAPADVDMLSASSADRPSDTMTPGALPSPTPADDTAATYTDPATAADPTTEADESSEASAPETDMDTSSDRSYIADTPELAPVADLARHDSPCVSRLRMPSAEPHFSRSQVPSPPNAHSLGVRPALRACDSPASGAVSGIGTPRHLAAVFGSSSAVCSSERGRLVVFVDESSSDSGSESGSDSDDGTGTLATPVGESSDGQLLQAKMDLREKEAAIARLKLQISQKQTRALLRKRLQQSLLQRAGTLSSTPTNKRAAAQERLRLLQAEMALAQAELVAAEYAIQADHECSSMIDAD